MRTFTRTVLPILVVILVVGGVSYFSQYTEPPPVKKKPGAGPGVINAPSLVLPEARAVWDAFDPGYSREVEANYKGKYDYWAFNPHPVEARITLRAKSCTCAKVEVGILPADAMVQPTPDMVRLSLARHMIPIMGFDPTCLRMASVVDKIKFEPLKENGSIIVPPADDELGPRWCIVRMDFEAKNHGMLTMTSDITVTGGNQRQQDFKAEVSVAVVPAVRVAPFAIDLKEISASDPPPPMFLHLWTSTLDDFDIELPDVKDDPCYVLGKPEKLSEWERLQLAYFLRTREEYRGAIPPTRVRAAYRVPLTVHETIGSHQLPLGPFSRRLTFNVGTPNETVCQIAGRVRGDIQLIGKAVVDERIRLGNFNARAGETAKIQIIREEPGLKMKIVSNSPDWLQSKLKERTDAPGTWELTLVVPPDSATGPFPRDSGVTIEIEGKPPRRLRVPVTGSAYR